MQDLIEVEAALPGAGWRCCRIHFTRNITQTLGSTNSRPVMVSTIIAQTTPKLSERPTTTSPTP